MRYANGEAKIVATDLSSNGFGVPWGHTRSYSNQLTSQVGGANGNSWRVAEWPYLVEASPTVVCVVAGTIHDAVWFDLVSGQYVPRFFVQATLVHDSANQQFIYTDPNGLVTKFFDNSAGVPSVKQGQFKSYTDLGGNETAASYDANTNRIASFVQSSGGASRGFHYNYHAGGPNAGQLQHATLRVNGQDVRQASYDYYGHDARHGNLNDLMRVTIQQKNGSRWENLGVTYYRYYKPGEADGFAHGLRYAVGPHGYAQMVGAGINPETASNAQVARHADNHFQYHETSQGAVVEKVAGGTRHFRFSRTASGHPADHNNWTGKAVETLPDGTKNIVYTNFAAQPILSIYRSGSSQWFNYNRYDGAGRIILAAQSSAVESYDESTPGLVTLKPHEGLLKVYVYYTSTDIEAGAVAGYLQYEQVQQGGAGRPIILRQYQYTARAAGGRTIYLMAKETCYPDAADPLFQLQCYVYNYTWQDGTLLIDQKTTTFPAVPLGQNGSGVATSRKEAYDGYGNLTWAMDERSFLIRQSYDLATGSVTQLIQDVNTAMVGGVPAGWTTPAGGGLNLVTDYTIDGLGRVTQTLGPTHNIDINGTNTPVRRATWTVYQDALFQVWSGAGYATGAGPNYTYTLINPASLTFMDPIGRVTDQIQAERSTPSGPLSAGDTFPQNTWVRWTHRIYAAGMDVAVERVYFAIPPSGAGIRGTHYDETHYGYDLMQRQVRTQTPGRTISRTVYQPKGWVLENWTGTNDNEASESDPSGGGAPGNNMVMVESKEYDGNAAGGDGNLTRNTKYQDASTARATNYSYDWRNRQTVIDGEIDYYQVTMHDNLDRVIRVDRRDTSASGNLIGRTVTNYDNRGKVYQTITYAVNPNTGAVGNSLVNNTWFDPSGNVIKTNQAGSNLLQKTVYDGAGRATIQYQSYNTSETGYPYPVSVAGDTVMQQTETAYDDADNVILQTTRDRFHDATGTGTLTSPVGAQPKARVNYAAFWPDVLGRPHHAADYGTHQGKALTRPATARDRSATVLVTTTHYNSRGEAYRVVDTKGTVNQSKFDDARRLVKMLENFVAGGTASDQNRETDYSYMDGHK